MRQAVDDVNQLMRGRVVIAMVTACNVTPLFDALAAFHLAHPGVEITLREDSSDRMAEQVRTGLVDLALVGCAEQPPTDLESRSIISEGLVALVPGDHVLPPQRDDACRSPRIQGGDEDDHNRRRLGRFELAAQGLHPTVALQASAPAAVVDLARRGLGIAILSESMTMRHDHHLARVPLTGVNVPAVLALIWKHTSNPAVHELVRHCGATFNIPSAA